MLRGLKGYYEGSDSIDRAELHAYVSPLQLQQVLPGLQAIAFVGQATAGEMAEHEARMRALGIANYAVRPPGRREQYRPLILIEPQTEDNLRVVGVDTATVPGALEAQNRARDSGLPALTEGLVLRQDVGAKTTPSVVMYLPIYRGEMPTGSVMERRQALRGWVSGPFHVKAFVEGIGRLTDDAMALAIYDGPADQPASLLYQSTSFMPRPSCASGTRIPLSPSAPSCDHSTSERPLHRSCRTRCVGLRALARSRRQDATGPWWYSLCRPSNKVLRRGIAI